MGFGDDEYPMKRIPSVVEAPSQNLESCTEDSYSRDEVELARYGKKQQLRVCALLSNSLILLLNQPTNLYPHSEILDYCPSLD